MNLAAVLSPAPRSAHARAAEGRSPPARRPPRADAWVGLGTPPALPWPSHKKCRPQQACGHRPQCRLFFFRSEKQLTSTRHAVRRRADRAAPSAGPAASLQRAGGRRMGAGLGRAGSPAPGSSAHAPSVRAATPFPAVVLPPVPGERRGRCSEDSPREGRPTGPGCTEKTNPCFCSVAASSPQHCCRT